ncbi:uncharacterized protein Z519_06099 [Cladophialophora bantiana CBS 173.52]|uniref:Uncharacterized protein n=1 Tax=Cladophialophora bantiana (strain ATCC 10958 / CBS 173.52 / CDC B-1940 / NIH 8579) TaxID=1442370 RepID=A0A0D2I9Q8_CLAB1|nr:uncharacterized protein Z519_06099 [Cladophialophora bantiana CBS 173.52]KIW93494.1 hypothetical protein Z519_06099 [Cladophialophora bantiana CBS 173.52]
MEPPLSRVPRRWTPEEDSILRAEATYQLIAAGSVRGWNRIASKLPGRMEKDCRKRWSKISENVKKGNWDPAEDAKLREAVQAIGTRWTQVAEAVGTRHADQCAKRWTQCLDPSIDHSDWREEEDNRLLAEVTASGRNWKKIAEYFPGRTKLALKNRYTALRRRQHSRQTSNNTESPRSQPRLPTQALRAVSDDLIQISDEIPSSEEEVCSSMDSTRPPSRSSIQSMKPHHQAGNLNMVVDSSSEITTSALHADSGDRFQYMSPMPNRNLGFHHCQSVNHSIPESNNFSPLNVTTLSEPMLTSRPEYLQSDNSYSLHASSLPNEWLLGGTTSNQNIHGFPFPESFDISPTNGIDRQYPLQQSSSRKKTIALEDIEETTLSKVVSILIQEKAKVRIETTVDYK